MPATQDYNPVTPRIVEELNAVVGAKNVFFGDPEKLQAFSHDEIPDVRYAHMPEAVVRPGSAQEIAAVLKLANRERFPVTPRGAGSGLSGGAVPLHGGVVLLLDRLNRILEVDRANMMVVVEPGVVTNHINEVLEPYGLFYPGYPMSLETCFIGGNVAENAGGAKAVKYGVTSRYVVGLELVTPTGDFLSLGGKRVKDVTGYDLLHLMVGSEGTLGVFTKITLRLLPLPKAAVDLLCLYRTTEEAIAAVPRIMTGAGSIPAAIEYIDQPSARVACDYLNESIPLEDCAAMLLVTVDGSDAGLVEREYDAIGEEALRAGAVQVFVADNATTSERLWRVRRNVAEAIALLSPHQANEDLSVPMAQVPKLVRDIERLGRKYEGRAFCYGHAGDGNIHCRIVKNPSWSVERWRETLPALLTELFTLAAGLGGTISGEHGIGHKRKAYMHLVCSPAAIEMMKAVKRVFDPNNILNPGKIFDL
jgi:glycolate oxidase